MKLIHWSNICSLGWHSIWAVWKTIQLVWQGGEVTRRFEIWNYDYIILACYTQIHIYVLNYAQMLLAMKYNRRSLCSKKKWYSTKRNWGWSVLSWQFLKGLDEENMVGNPMPSTSPIFKRMNGLMSRWNTIGKLPSSSLVEEMVYVARKSYKGM